MVVVSNTNLLDVLRQTRLLSADQLEVVQQALSGQRPDVRTLARLLVQMGWLTVYQMNQLLAGHGEELVVGPYQILDKLGQGGQSTVYLARHPETGWVVALKVIKGELLGHAEA